MKHSFLTCTIFILILSCSSGKKWISSNTKINEGLHDVGVINDKVAFSYSYGTGSLYKTIDSGNNWNKIHQFDSLYFEQIQFLDNLTGWLAGSPNKLYKTNDGGINWIDKSIKQSSKSALIYGMYFENSQIGYIATLNRSAKGFSSKIFKTKNNGESWEVVNEIDEMILNIESVNGVLYATGRNVIIKDVEKRNLWKYSYKDSTNTIGIIRDLDINDDRIIAVSDNGFIIKFDNGIWKENKITENRLRSIIYIENSEWIIVGDSNKEKGNLFESHDNGNTWEVEGKITSDIHRIGKSKNRIYIVGKDGLIFTKKY